MAISQQADNIILQIYVGCVHIQAQLIRHLTQICWPTLSQMQKEGKKEFV